MIVADKLLKAIDAALDKDFGNAYRFCLEKYLPLQNDAYRVEQSTNRRHLGASALGNECARAIWYSFRWCGYKKPEPRLIRLFNRGHLEEARFRALLTIAGVSFSNEKPGYKSKDGLFAMTSDGVVSRVPGAKKNEKFVVEFKTYNDKRFNTLEKKGVKESDPAYYDQLQTYLKHVGGGIKRGLFMAVNKNTDALHAEFIAMESHWQDSLATRAEYIIGTDVPPPKISEQAVFFKCKMCDHADLCHNKAQPSINCRTCAHWEAGTDGPRCVLKDIALSNELGCLDHVYNPHLVALPMVGGDGNNAVYHGKNGEKIVNGPDGLNSNDFWSGV